LRFGVLLECEREFSVFTGVSFRVRRLKCPAGFRSIPSMNCPASAAVSRFSLALWGGAGV